MIARKVTAGDIYQAARAARVDVTGSQGQRGEPLRASGRGFRFTLLPVGERFRRRSHQGRRINAVCWHGHRAFMAALFEQAPNATIITTMARYDGIDIFEALAGHTGDRNIGSMMEPLPYRYACDC